MTTLTKTETGLRKQRAIETLLSFDIRPGSTIYTTLLHTSRSGMMRVIKVIVPGDGQVFDLSGAAARAVGARYDDHRGGVIMTGCGMDMGYAVVYDLSRVLFADGFACTGVIDGPRRCPSNDHSNERGDDADWTPGRIHSDPGYALHHQWL